MYVGEQQSQISIIKQQPSFAFKAYRFCKVTLEVLLISIHCLRTSRILEACVQSHTLLVRFKLRSTPNDRNGFQLLETDHK